MVGSDALSHADVDHRALACGRSGRASILNMAEQPAQDTVMVPLTHGEASIVAAALRQYRPYMHPDDPDRLTELAELVSEISILLDRLRPHVITPAPGLLGAFQANPPR